MAHTLFRNNAESTLSSAITAADTSMTVADGTQFESPGANQVAYLTLRRILTGDKEVVSYTTLTGNVISGMTRNVDPIQGGSALTFGVGDTVEHRIPKIALDEFYQRQGVNAGGDNRLTGDLEMSNAAGPAIVNEATTSTNPTIIPDRSDRTTGVGSQTPGALSLIAGGVEVGRVNTTLFSVRAATDGPGLTRETASQTNPTLVPNIGDLDTGIGWAAANQLSIIAGGFENMRFRGTGNRIIAFEGIEITDAAGPAMLNEAASATNPTLLPDKTDAGSGMGSAGTNLPNIIVNSVEAIRFSESGGNITPTVTNPENWPFATQGFSIAMAIALGG